MKSAWVAETKIDKFRAIHTPKQYIAGYARRREHTPTKWIECFNLAHGEFPSAMLMLRWSKLRLWTSSKGGIWCLGSLNGTPSFVVA